MALLNGGFEEAGPTLGAAAHWTLSVSTSLEELAGFGTDPEQAWEGFERWYDLVVNWDAVSTARAFFNPGQDGFEAFERGWGAGVFLWELPPAQLVVAPFGPADVENCEGGWSNDVYLVDWSATGNAAAIFDGEPREDFEDQWRSNQSFAWSWAAVSSSAALFDAGTQAREDFENDWTHATTL